MPALRQCLFSEFEIESSEVEIENSEVEIESLNKLKVKQEDAVLVSDNVLFLLEPI